MIADSDAKGSAPSIGGGASTDVVRETAARDSANIPTAAASDPLAFTTSVLDYVQDRRLRNGGQLGMTKPAVFVFADYPRSEADARGFQRVQGFVFASARDISGALHVSSASLTDVFELRDKCDTVEQAFEALSAARLDDKPSVIILPDANEAIVCSEGSRNEALCGRVSLVQSTLSDEAISALLTTFYEVWLRVPEDYARIWHGDASLRVPVERAEKAIQRLLFPFARSTFRSTHDVRREDDTPAGRADITIIPLPDQQSPDACVLELKVLRAKHFNVDPQNARRCPATVNEAAIVEGINQAVNYRREKHLSMAYLCCYDCRDADDNAVIDQYAGQAVTANVRCCRYFLYASEQEFRNAQPDAVRRVARNARSN